MRIMVTGSCGFIGRHLTDALLRAGHDVVGLDNLTHATDATFKTLVCDVQDLHGRRGEPSCDLIFHLASPVGPALLTPRMNVAYEIITGAKAVLDYARYWRDTSARVVMFSTSEVYAWNHDTPLDTRAQYALGKLAMEAMTLSSGVPCQIIRPFNVVGPLQKEDGGFVFPRFISQVKREVPLTIFGTGQQRRSFTHVSDVVKFCLSLINEWPVSGQVWDLYNQFNYTSINGLAAMVIRMAGKGTMIHAEGKEVLNNETWRDTIERPMAHNNPPWWTPEVMLEEIVREALRG